MARLTKVNRDELYALSETQVAHEALRRAGQAVARNAQRRADKDTGAGAASIHAERAGDGYRVSWDAEHDYMQYVELGTRTREPRPFLRPAVRDVQGGN